MKAVRFHQHGEPADVRRVAEVPAPEAGPGQLLVRLTARPVNPSDMECIRDGEGVRPELPAVPGFEGGWASWDVNEIIVRPTFSPY